MQNLPQFLINILQTLASRYGMSFSLEKLTSLLTPIFNVSTKFTNNMFNEAENQAKVLEALIILNDEGYIFLNSSTEKSSITIKGLIKLNDNVFCN